MDKIRVPSYVGDWIVAKVANGDSLVVALDTGWQIMPSRVREWLGIEFNDEVFARAWLDGYVCVEEKKTHTLKIYSEFFEALKEGKKTFEIRENDRDFRVGDILKLAVFSEKRLLFTSEFIYFEITYITSYQQKDGYVVLGIKEVKK